MVTKISRNLPLPYFTKSVVDGWLVIKTKVIEISYKENSGRFCPSNLSVKHVKNTQHAFTWVPGKVQKENFMGIARPDALHVKTKPGLLNVKSYL